METVQGDPAQPTDWSKPALFAGCLQMMRERPRRFAKLRVLLNEPGGDSAKVEKDVCLACCRLVPALTLRDLNPVVASIVYTRATQLAKVMSSEASSRRLHRAREVAREALDLLYVEPLELPRASDRARQRLLACATASSVLDKRRRVRTQRWG